jgi:hypothetical protein
MLGIIQGYLGDFVVTYIKPYHDELLAVATILIAIFTIVLARISRKQTKDSRIINRAYLNVIPLGIRPFESKDGRLSCDVGFKNTGHLPARKVEWIIKPKFSDRPEDNIFPINKTDKYSGENIVHPGDMMRKGGAAIRDSDFEKFVRENQIADKSWLYVYGIVRYKDGFRIRRRFRRFCFRYNLVGIKGQIISHRSGRQHEYGNRTDQDLA